MFCGLARHDIADGSRAVYNKIRIQSSCGNESQIHRGRSSKGADYQTFKDSSIHLSNTGNHVFTQKSQSQPL